MSHIRSYMFPSTQTIFRELILSQDEVTLCKSNQYKYIVISCAVLWQLVFLLITFTKCNFILAQYKLSEDGPGGRKHVGANVGHFNVNFNILYV
jgi:hypothetical protein